MKGYCERENTYQNNPKEGMSVTTDVGENVMRAVREAFSDNDFLFDHGFDWCFQHDNNTIFGFCACCSDEVNGGEWTVENIVQAGRQAWKEFQSNKTEWE